MSIRITMKDGIIWNFIMNKYIDFQKQTFKEIANIIKYEHGIDIDYKKIQLIEEF